MSVADVFRSEWPPLVATLVRDVGDLTIAEDAAQDAFVEASLRWPDDGYPDRPGAWLLTTARRRAIDQIRRMRRFEDRIPVDGLDGRHIDDSDRTALGIHGNCCLQRRMDGDTAGDDRQVFAETVNMRLAELEGCAAFVDDGVAAASDAEIYRLIPISGRTDDGFQLLPVRR